MPDRLADIRARLDAAGAFEPLAHDPLNAYADACRDLIAHAPADIAWLLDELQQAYWDVDEAIRKGEDAADYYKQQFEALRKETVRD